MRHITADSLKELCSIKNRILRLCKKIAKKEMKVFILTEIILNIMNYLLSLQIGKMYMKSWKK